MHIEKRRKQLRCSNFDGTWPRIVRDQVFL